MRVVVTGGTGFVGRALVAGLLRRGHEVAVPTRNPRRAEAQLGGSVTAVPWDGCDPRPLAALMEAGRESAVVNLAGENIGAGRWTEARKRRILESRVLAGRAVVEAARIAAGPPVAVVQASAVGWYGPRASEDGRVLTEDKPRGPGFLAEVCEAWEASAEGLDALGVRHATARLGIVLGRGGGVLEKFLPPFRAYVGGRLGGGGQWVSWVHRDDAAGALAFLLEDDRARGVFNVCAPVAVTMSDFCRELGRAAHRPSWLPVPAFALKLALGAEMAEETVLASQRAAPARLLESGYEFQKPGLAGAFAACLG